MKYFCPILCLSFLTSCIPFRYIDIEYFDKPSVDLSSAGKNITILTNLHFRDTLTKLGKLDWYMDSISSMEATLALTEIARRSPTFEGNLILNQTITRTDTNMVIAPLKWNVVDGLGQQNNSNFLVSLEYLKVRPFFDSYPVWRTDYKEYYGFIDVSIYAYWRVYDLSRRKVILGRLFTDTLSWEKYDFIEVRPGNQLPGVFEACAYAGAYTGEAFAEAIAPQWHEGERLIYVPFGNKLMGKAYSFAIHGKWLDAAAIWQKLSSASSPKLAAQASFNMALASEMNGKFDLAIKWLESAKRKHPSLGHVNKYMLILEKRDEKNR